MTKSIAKVSAPEPIVSARGAVGKVMASLAVGVPDAAAEAGPFPAEFSARSRIV